MTGHQPSPDSVGARRQADRAGHEPSQSTLSRPDGDHPSREHTPLPWGISYGFGLGLSRSPATYIAGPSPEQVGIKLASPWREGAWDNDPEADANVAFIVRACNAHYELTEALADIMENPLFQTAIGGNLNMVEALMARASVALAKARGES